MGGGSPGASWTAVASLIGGMESNAGRVQLLSRTEVYEDRPGEPSKSRRPPAECRDSDGVRRPETLIGYSQPTFQLWCSTCSFGRSASMDPLTMTAAGGLRARMESLELLANNLANSETTGYKTD